MWKEKENVENDCLPLFFPPSNHPNQAPFSNLKQSFLFVFDFTDFLFIYLKWFCSVAQSSESLFVFKVAEYRRAASAGYLKYKYSGLINEFYDIRFWLNDATFGPNLGIPSAFQFLFLLNTYKQLSFRLMLSFRLEISVKNLMWLSVWMD